jgi:hypothetical protein
MSAEKEPLTENEIKQLENLKNSPVLGRIDGHKGLWFVRHDAKLRIPPFVLALMDAAYDEGREEIKEELYKLCKLLGVRR